MRIANNVAELVGNTPLVKLNRLAPANGATVALKLEFFNPAHSVKDRIAVAMLDAAEAAGKITPDTIVLEPTSGNTGIGLALVAQQRGYRTIFVVPDKVSESKRAVLRAYGAEVVVTPTDAGPDDPRSYYQVAERLANTIPGGFRPNQYDNPNGPLSHYYTTGPEIWEATDHKVTHFVAGIGTGGTITGVAEYIKAWNSMVRIVAVEPAECAAISGGFIGQHGISGIGPGFVPENYNPYVVDTVLTVTTADAERAAREVLFFDGVPACTSAGATLAAAVQLMGMGKAKRPLCVFAGRHIYG